MTTPETPAEKNPASNDGGAGCAWGCLIVIAIPFVLFAIFWIGSALSGGSGSSDHSPYEAEMYCEDKVETQLKSPSTAEFDLTATGSGSTFTVTGTVDSENSFGAMVRNNVGCTVTITGDSYTVRVDYLG